jgi:hypothetical protein
VEESFNTSTGIIIYTYKYIENVFPQVGLLEETKEGEKEGMVENINSSLSLYTT